MTIERFNISGIVAPGFEPVRDAFVKNFEDGLESGAGFCAYYNGELVVDLVGGWADQSKTIPLTKDNVFVVHSSGKALMSMSILYAISQGKLSYDTKVCQVWPEFGTGGKGDVMVKDLLEHMGGVAWLDDEHRPTLEELLNLNALARRIATQPHNYGGQLTKSYHAVTRGFFLNEILRRTLGVTQGPHMQKWGATLGVQVYVGLPESADPKHVPVIWSPGARAGIGFAHSLGRDHPHNRSLINSSVKDVPFPEENVLHSNCKSILRGEVPSAFTCSNAQGLAAFANIMALGGSSAEIEIANAETFATAHTLEIRNLDQTDTVLMTPVATTCGGFGKSMVGTKIPNVRLDFTTVPPTPTIPEEYKGDGWSWYGWMGLGGSMIMWDYKRKAAIGYAPTLLGVGGGNNDERAARLNLAFVNAIEAREATGLTPTILDYLMPRLRGKGEGTAYG